MKIMSSYPTRAIALGLLTASSIFLSPDLCSQKALAQRVVNVNPAPSTPDVPADSSISGVFDTSDGSMVDPRTIKIFLNDTDVSRSSTITPNFFSYRPNQPLRPGPNNVRVEFNNTRGQNWRVTWAFNVLQPQATLSITSVTHNANDPLGTGATFLATINGTPGARGMVLLVENGTTVRVLPTQEVSPGVYVATLTLVSQQRIQDGAVVGRLERQGTIVYGAASQSVVFDPAVVGTQVTQVSPSQPVQTPVGANPTVMGNLQPRFTSHQDGGTVNTQGFTLTGETQPGAVVKILVLSRFRALGGLINIGGDTPLVQQELRADAQGRFQVQVPRPPVSSSGVQYLIQATASNGSQISETRMMLVQQ